MKYSIIIPTAFAHLESDLKPCIESILKYTDLTPDIEVIVVSNGCTDGTDEYVKSLGDNFVLITSKEALGYAKAVNAGIKASTGTYVILLNNDITLLDQPKNQWLKYLEEPFLSDQLMAVTGPIKGFSDPAGRDFIVFFCAALNGALARKFLLPEDYGVGGGEDTDFCIHMQNLGYHTTQVPQGATTFEGNKVIGGFPIYHVGEATMHKDIPNWQEIFDHNSLLLAKKYNPDWYKWKISNECERAVIDSNEDMSRFPREVSRYQWAAKNLLGKKVLEFGCSSGYGLRMLPSDIEYTGVDYDKTIIEFATKNFGNDKRLFINQDAHDFLQLMAVQPAHFDTIIAFEFIEHIEDGRKFAQSLKSFCDRLLITTPYKEIPGLWGHHHKIHGITEKDFPGFEHTFLSEDGRFIPAAERFDGMNLMMMKWTSIEPARKSLAFLRSGNEDVFDEVIKENTYQLTVEEMEGRQVVDVGANRGMFSIFAQALGAKEILAFEPVNETYDLMRVMIAGLNENIYTYRMAVTDTDGEQVKIYTNPTRDLSDSLYAVTDTFDTANTISLAKIVKDYKVEHGILKLDCEGAEYDIILNSPVEVLQKFDIIYLELHTDMHPKYKGDALMSLCLSTAGFTRVRGDQFGNTFPDGKFVPEPYRLEKWVKTESIAVEKPKVLAFVPTKNRYDCLALTIQAIALQTTVPDKLLIYDDGEHKDIREMPTYKHLLNLLALKGIAWEVIFGYGKGQHHGHQIANKFGYTYVWRIDDDEVPEPTVLTSLLGHMTSDVGAVAGAVIIPGEEQAGGSGLLEDIFCFPNLQWKANNGVHEVDHLYSSFLYRAGIADYDLRLSPVAHREETLFSHAIKLAGYKLIVDTGIKTYHYRHPSGGIRDNGTQFNFDHDNHLFLETMEKWGYKVIALDSGLGDHLAFLNIVPELEAKFNKIIIGVCYPEVFKDCKKVHIVPLDPIKQTKSDDDNIYKWMWDHNWTRPLMEAYRQKFL